MSHFDNLSAMIPQLSRKPFLPYELLVVGDENTCISLVPEKSGYIHQIRINGRDLLWNYPDGHALTTNSGHRNLALLPFPNRLYKGEYSWQGGKHIFSKNNPLSNSALHGFEHNAAFRLTQVELMRDKAVVKLGFLHRAEMNLSRYPFDVSFEIRLEVDCQKHTVGWYFKAKNVDNKVVPVGLGWHPYYLLHNAIEACKIVMPPNERIEMYESIPTGNVTEGVASGEPININPAWDDCFLLSDDNSKEVFIRALDAKLSLKQVGNTSYTQLYVPPGAHSLAVEPMSCGVDAFRQNQVEVALAPGESTSIGVLHAIS